MEIKLREIREQRNLSQEETAEKMHISQSAYARFELTKTKIDLERLEKFASVMGMSIIDVLTYPERYVNSTTFNSADIASGAEVTVQIKLKESQKQKLFEMVLGHAIE
ncbi:MAG: helix-turn-helix transcriptional regulator [Bacteroidales bacterium]|nr:helix-turn-helix transcriptional regulator [Bacteroidales bacterium]